MSATCAEQYWQVLEPDVPMRVFDQVDQLIPQQPQEALRSEPATKGADRHDLGARVTRVLERCAARARHDGDPGSTSTSPDRCARAPEASASQGICKYQTASAGFF